LKEITKGMLRLRYLLSVVFIVALQACILMPRQEENPALQFTGGTMLQYPGFASAVVPTRNIEIWLPPSYKKDGTKKYPVLYMHDGQNLFNKTTAFGGEAWEVDSIAEASIASGKINELIIVGIWNTNRRFWEYFPQKALQNLSTAEQKAALTYHGAYKGSDSIYFGADYYLQFLVKELKPFIDSNYRTKQDAANTMIAGSSMGGLISLYALCEYPAVFGKAACISTHWPIVFNNSNQVPAAAVKKYFAAHLPGPANHFIYYDYGTAKLDSLYAPHQQQIDSIMQFKGYEQNKSWVTKEFKNAEHSEVYWRQRFGSILEILQPKK
jgi:predicted alpha/beta superfamily hydrolase